MSNTIFKETTDLLELEAQNTPEIDPREKLDGVELTAEQKAVRDMNKRAKYEASIVDRTTIHVPAHEVTWDDRRDNDFSMYLDDCDVELIMLAGMPDAPQLTATATETRGGSMRLADEA